VSGRRPVLWIGVCAFLFCAVATPAAGEYQTVDFRLLHVTIDTDWAPRAAPGYFPARFEIRNVGDARVIEIVGEGTRMYRGPRSLEGGSTFVHQSVRLAMGDTVRLTIPVPIYADSENLRFEIREQNRVIYAFNYVGFQSGVAAKDASALVVAAPGSPLRTIELRAAHRMVPPPLALGTRGSGRPFTTATLVRTGPAAAVDFQLEPSRLPANWLGYTSLRAVVLGPAEWAQLTDGQKTALLTWTASGGDLIVVDGDVRTLLPSAQPQPATNPDRMEATHLFGRVTAVRLASVAPGIDDLLSVAEATRDWRWSLPANHAPDWGVIEGRGFRLRIPGVDGVPARVYLGILLLFSVLIGPMNYWILRRKRQQVLMVVTAPLISAAFIVLLAGYAIAGNGFRVQGRAVTFTVLDQLTKQAATRATVSLFAAGLTPSSGLRFGRDVAVWAVGPDGTGLRDRMDLDLTDTQQFADGVLLARAPTNLDQVTFRPARERLTFSPAGGGMSVTNGLDATILGLVYRDGNTTYRLEGPLSVGAKQTIGPGAFALPDGASMPAKFADLLQHQPAGSYVAVLERSPFWEPGVPRLSERGSVHVVLGWLEGQR